MPFIPDLNKQAQKVVISRKTMPQFTSMAHQLLVLSSKNLLY